MREPDLSPAHRRPVRLLPEETVRRIAAGEVITRPAAVVKELVENAIDAGARQVKVEVRSGGKAMIRVLDDGVGMTREDVRLAISRHATSKIDGIEDLTRIRTFGFRGEALAAIAAVTRFSIETNTDPDQPGTGLLSEGGNIIELREVARPRGTTVTCRSLFYNLPVRQAFLKSDSYELRLILEQMRAYAMACPEVAFEMVADERRLMSLPPAESLKERLRDLFERRLLESLVELKLDVQLFSLAGFLSHPTQVRSFADVQAVFFNGRPVRSRTITKAVYEGYGALPAGSNPDYLIFLSTDPARLDVNIHPTKQEVRFSDEKFLFDVVVDTVRQSLGIQRGSETAISGVGSQGSLALGEVSFTDFWQLHNTYVLAQVASGYVIVDQHAAHERILFEAILKGRQTAPPQGLLFPITVELSGEEFEAFELVSERLSQMGLEAKAFSGNTVVVEAIPAGSFMGRDEVKELFVEIARAGAGQVEVDVELAKMLACKGAVKAGQRLAQAEMESLINRLFACKEPYFCPHGRPAIIRIPTEELDRRFGRT